MVIYKDEHPLPFVSVCTPTFNRRPFIKSIIQCFLNQNYPMTRMEWIIVDDGTDPIEDLVKDVSGVRYFYIADKMPLGKKRNFMHEQCRGDMIVYMDDDDYYPRERVSHAVGKLMKNPEALCAGSSEMYIYFKDMQKLYQFGPYGDSHATAGTFAFKKQLLDISRYDDDACLAEERYFLKNYTIPFVQLDPLKTILVFSHPHNTFDKRKLLENKDEKFCIESSKTVEDFVKEKDLMTFFMEEIDDALKNYAAGLPEMKPDVLKQTAELEEKRKHSSNSGKIVMQQSNGMQVVLENKDVIDMLKYQNGTILGLHDKINDMKYEIDILKEELARTQQNQQSDDSTNIQEELIVQPIDISGGMYLEMRETDVLPQINSIN